MDASVEKRFKNRLGIFAKANNLLNSPMTIFINNASAINTDVPHQTFSGKTLIRQNYSQRSYYFGLRYCVVKMPFPKSSRRQHLGFSN